MQSQKRRRSESVAPWNAMSLNMNVKIVVARLKNSLAVDPFCAEQDICISVTEGGLIGPHENAAE
jgi:hypothetical protein